MDCIDRQAALDAIIKRLGIKNETYLLEAERVIYQQILAMPSVTPQEPVKKLEKQIKQLQNRCHALTHGQICVFCPYECEHKAEVRDKE